MTHKKQSTQSTFIYAGDTSIASLGISRIEPKKTSYLIKGLSLSAENLRWSITYVIRNHVNLSLKAVNFLIGLVQGHQKLEICTIFRPKQNKESKLHIKQIKLRRITTFISQRTDLYPIQVRSIDPWKDSQNVFFIIWSSKNLSRIQFQQVKFIWKQLQGEKDNFKMSLREKITDWRVNKSDEKIKFSNKCKAVPHLQLANLKNIENKCVTQRNTHRNTERVKERLMQQNTQRAFIKVEKEPAMTSRKQQKPKSYLEMYNSRRVVLK